MSLFVSGGVLMAQVFDVDRLELTGEARPIGPQVSSPGVIGTWGQTVFRFRRTAF